MVTIDPIPAMLGVLGYQVLGFLWYGPIFGGIWMDAMGETLGFEEGEGLEGESPTVGYAMTAIGSLVAVVVLAVLIDWTGATSWEMGLGVGGLAGIGFVATTGLQAVPFEDRPWTAYLLNTGYNVLALAGIGGLLAVW